MQEKVCGEGGRVFRAGAFDWKATQAGSLDVDIYENDLDVLKGENIGSFKRISKPIDSACPHSPALSVFVAFQVQKVCTCVWLFLYAPVPVGFDAELFALLNSSTLRGLGRMVT